MRVFFSVLVLIFSLQSWTKAEELILKCSGVSIISEGATKPLDSIYKKIINLDKKKTYRLLLYTSVPMALFLSINYEIIFVVIKALLSGRDFNPMTYGIFEGIPAIIVNDPFLTIFGGNIDYQYSNASNYNYLEMMEVFFVRLIQYCGLGALIIYFAPFFSTRIWRKDVLSRFTLLLLFCVLLSGVHYEVMITAANLLLSSTAFTMFILCKDKYLVKV